MFKVEVEDAPLKVYLIVILLSLFDFMILCQCVYLIMCTFYLHL
jgi:hypothetical protein